MGVNTIVDFLKKKGYDVDSNPNSKITAKQYELLQREYASDQMAKKLSEREAEIEKERRRAINAENKANKAANSNQVSSSDSKEAKVLDSNQRLNNNPKPQNQQRNDKHRSKYQEPAVPKVIGKIDLSALNTKTHPDKKQSGQQDRNRQQQQQQQPKAENTASQRTVQPATPAPTAAKPAEQPAAASVTSTPQSGSPEIFRPGTIQLSGPKVLGKIDLEDTKKKRNRKRKRVNKERVDIAEAATQQSNDKKDKKDNSRKGDKKGSGDKKNADREKQQQNRDKSKRNKRQQGIQEISQEDIDRHRNAKSRRRRFSKCQNLCLPTSSRHLWTCRATRLFRYVLTLASSSPSTKGSTPR